MAAFSCMLTVVFDSLTNLLKVSVDRILSFRLKSKICDGRLTDDQLARMNALV